MPHVCSLWFRPQGGILYFLSLPLQPVIASFTWGYWWFKPVGLWAYPPWPPFPRERGASGISYILRINSVAEWRFERTTAYPPWPPFPRERGARGISYMLRLNFGVRPCFERTTNLPMPAGRLPTAISRLALSPLTPLSEGKRGERHFVYTTAKLWCETLLRTDY